MQSLLYLSEEAKAHEQNGKPNLALKKYMAIKKVCLGTVLLELCIDTGAGLRGD